MSCLYKAQYYSHGNVLNTTRSIGSFVWNSIIESKLVLNEGATCAIGDGHAIPLFDNRRAKKQCRIQPRKPSLFNPFL